MSSFPPSSSTNKPNLSAYEDAIQRAQQVASKLKSERGESAETGARAGALAGVKRSSSDTFQGPQTKKFSMENGTTAEQITVPDKMVGMIIGRGGEQINRLQQESGCKIQMAPDSGGQSVRMCTLTGNPDSIAKAKALIDDVIENNGNMMGGGGGAGGGGGVGGVGGGGSGAGGMSHGGGQPGLFEIMVPGHKVGLVIGKGGETIKMLQDQTGAKIIIIQENTDHADQKPLRITGSPEAVQMAQARIMELLNQIDQRQANGFAGRGRGGAGMRGSPRGGGFAGRGRGRGMSGWPGGNDGGEKVDYITVTSDKVGLVIGKGGETIKSINQASGAYCEIDKKAPPDATEKNFVIRGTAESVEKAKQMVLEKIGAAPGSGYGSFPGQTFAQNESGGMYGSHGGPQAGGFNPSGPGYEQPQNHYQPTTGGAPGPPGQDYSAQWVDYYRSIGMNKEAEMIEQQQAATATSGAGPAGPGGAPPSSQPVQPQGSGGPDYSAQWAEYYRSMGKIKEAEAIEAQMRAKSGGQAGFATGGTAPGQPHYPGQPGQPGYAGQGYYPPQQAGYPGYD